MWPESAETHGLQFGSSCSGHALCPGDAPPEQSVYSSCWRGVGESKGGEGRNRWHARAELPAVKYRAKYQHDEADPYAILYFPESLKLIN